MTFQPDNLLHLLSSVRLLAMDVDGVLTDGGVYYDSTGGETKRFHVMDGLGLVLMRQIGVTVVWISGRSSVAVTRRAAELRIPVLLEGIRDKEAALLSVAGELGVVRAEIAYIGDDWNDLPAFRVAGVAIAVANASEDVKSAATGVTARPGGSGAVREVCELILDARNLRPACVQEYLLALQHSEVSAAVGQ